jgi:hypothetical protein
MDEKTIQGKNEAKKEINTTDLHYVNIVLENVEGDIVSRAKKILQRIFEERTEPMGGHSHDKYSFHKNIYLCKDSKLPFDGFKIEKLSDDEIRVTGGGEHGILYGCGKLLRLAEISPRDIIFHDSPEVSAPVKKDRGMYFCVHNYNFSQVAPEDVLIEYLEDLALWGINDCAVIYHKFQYTGLDQPEAKEYLTRLNLILRTAESLGMKTTVFIMANDGFINSPMELRYKTEIPRNWGTEICPSNPKGMELLKREFEESLLALKPLDQMVMWPYDSGGCGCEKCYPWGSNGYMLLSKEFSKIFHRVFPKGKFYLGTWFFDYNCGNIGDWDALLKKFDNKELDWIDGILADGTYVNGYFPKQVVENKHRIDKPIISFLDISMPQGGPWGGFGSNPMPKHIQEQWNLSKDLIIGGLPYTEGIHEDINKVLWAQLCWDPERNTMDILKEYVSYEFSREHANEITKAIAAIEPSRWRVGKNRVYDFSGSPKVWEELSYYDRTLSWYARNSWRWRQTLLRAKIDAEMALSNGEPTAEVGRAYDELFRINYLNDRALKYIRPYDVIPDPEKGGKALMNLQRGKSITDFCSYNPKEHVDIIDSK